MKSLFLSGLAAAFLLAAPAAAGAQERVNWQALPAEREALAALDNQQHRALRTSVRHCISIGQARGRNSACVMLDLDRAMRQGGDALEAYHFALPRPMRYDENRHREAAVDRVAEAREKALQ